MGFDVDRLDSEDPFEIDDANRPHLYKHLPSSGDRPIAVGVEDILDAYLFGDPLFFPTDTGDADWLMIAEVPGLVLVVPLAPPKSGDPTKCRPIGLYGASEQEKKRYREGSN